MYKPNILVVDDDQDTLDILEVILQDEYKVVKAMNGQEVFEKVKEEKFDLIILDYLLPDIEGIEVCRKLRKDHLFFNIPILMLTGKGEVEDKVKGLDSGVDDYVVKPFIPAELVARVKMLIRRSNINLDANPLTRLPGNISINKELERRLKNKEKFAVLYIDLDDFKALNDYYGFEKGDEIIKETARILINSVQKEGTSYDFIGHIGGDDFVIVSTIENVENIAKRIINDFDKIAPNFYENKDRLMGYIEVEDRRGEKRRFGFVTISIGIVTCDRNFDHVAQISSLGAEVKGVAKKFPCSKYVFDRRGADV